MTHPVKWFSHDMPGAPVLNGVAGSIINVLDACLVNGWGLTAIDSISYDSGTGVATATAALGHSFVDYQVVRIEGADQAGFNGDHRVTAITGTTFTFEPATDPGVTDATGTISAKVAPADWDRPFDNGQGTRAIYKPGAGAVSTCVYCIDDTHTVTNWDYSGEPQARVYAAESASGIDTLGEQFENTANSSTYGWIRKTRYAAENTTPSEWTLIADNRLLYLFTRLRPTDTYSQSVYALGEIESYLPGDLWSAISCTGNYSESPSRGQSYFIYLGTESFRLSRKADQLGGVVTASLSGHRSAQTHMGGASGYQYPNPVDNGLIYSYPVQVSEHHAVGGQPTALRGYLPGIAYPLHDRPLAHRTKLDLTINGSVRKHLALLASIGTSYGQVLIDIDGPWRA